MPTETRRGLKVHRPKGQPFSYTVEPLGRGFRMHIEPDGGADNTVKVVAFPRDGGVDPAEIMHSARSYYAQRVDPTHCVGDFDCLLNFAAALRWAVRYARKWNAKHGLSPKEPSDA
jgi:hypothetical protein